jgi:hypothetical protein
VCNPPGATRWPTSCGVNGLLYPPLSRIYAIVSRPFFIVFSRNAKLNAHDTGASVDPGIFQRIAVFNSRILDWSLNRDLAITTVPRGHAASLGTGTIRAIGG